MTSSDKRYNGSDLGVFLVALGDFVLEQHAVRRNITLDTIIIGIEDNVDQWHCLQRHIVAQFDKRFPPTEEEFPIGAIFQALHGEHSSSAYKHRTLTIMPKTREFAAELFNAAFHNIFVNNVPPHTAFVLNRDLNIDACVKVFTAMGWYEDRHVSNEGMRIMQKDAPGAMHFTLRIQWDESRAVRIECINSTLNPKLSKLPGAGITPVDSGEDNKTEVAETSQVIHHGAVQGTGDDDDDTGEPRYTEPELLDELSNVFAPITKVVDKVLWLGDRVLGVVLHKNVSHAVAVSVFEEHFDKFELNEKKSKGVDGVVYDGRHKDIKFRITFPQNELEAKLKLRGSTKREARGEA